MLMILYLIPSLFYSLEKWEQPPSDGLLYLVSSISLQTRVYFAGYVLTVHAAGGRAGERV